MAERGGGFWDIAVGRVVSILSLFEAKLDTTVAARASPNVSPNVF
jgi:hypothetical protein